MTLSLRLLHALAFFAPLTSLTSHRCDRIAETPPADAATETAIVERAKPDPAPSPLGVVSVRVAHDVDAFTLIHAPKHQTHFVFLAARCGHPGGYMVSVAYAVAEYGDMIGLQGEQSCGSDGTSRSYDLDRTDRRIEMAKAAAGMTVDPEEQETILIGYSQGAEIAERLASRFPRKYRRFILIASPITPSPSRLGHADAVVTMAGSRDLQTYMRQGSQALNAAHVRSKYFVLPGAAHGAMGDDPNASFREALG